MCVFLHKRLTCTVFLTWGLIQYKRNELNGVFLTERRSYGLIGTRWKGENRTLPTIADQANRKTLFTSQFEERIASGGFVEATPHRMKKGFFRRGARTAKETMVLRVNALGFAEREISSRSYPPVFRASQSGALSHQSGALSHQSGALSHQSGALSHFHPGR